MKCNKELISKWYKMYQQGMSCEAIAIKVGSTRQRVYGYFWRNGYKLRPQSPLGKKLSEKIKLKLSISKLSENNPQWKGEEVKLPALHRWVQKRLLKPKKCDNCKISKPYDLANKGIYNRDLKIGGGFVGVAICYLMVEWEILNNSKINLYPN